MTDDTNPKDRLGALKIDLSVFPAVASVHGAHAMMDGAVKYGPYNWRQKKVRARVYVAAAERHLKAWAEGEETAADSGVHHLGHAIACMGILLDAQMTGNLVDDRPNSGGAFSALVDRLNAAVKAKAQSPAELSPEQIAALARGEIVNLRAAPKLHRGAGVCSCPTVPHTAYSTVTQQFHCNACGKPV